MDPRFDDPWKQREASTELIAVLDKVFATRTRNEWLQILKAGGLEMAFAPVNDMLEATSDPQALANDYIVKDAHPVAGEIKMVGSPLYFSRTPVRMKSGAPELGQHTEEVLTEALGYSREDVKALKDEGIIM